MLGLVEYSSSSGDDDGVSAPAPPPPPAPLSTRDQILATSLAESETQSDDSDSEEGKKEAEGSGVQQHVPRLNFGSLPKPKSSSRKGKKKKSKKKKPKKEKKKRTSDDRDGLDGSRPHNAGSRSKRKLSDSDDGSDVQDGIVGILDSAEQPLKKKHRPQDDQAELQVFGPSAVGSDPHSGLVFESVDQGPALPPEFHPSDMYALGASTAAHPEQPHMPHAQQSHVQPPQQQSHGLQQSHSEVPALPSDVPTELMNKSGGKFAKELQRIIASQGVQSINQNQQLQLSAAEQAMIKDEQELLEKHAQLNPGSRLAAPSTQVKASKVARSRHQIGTLAAHAQGIELDLLRQRQHREKMRAISKSRYGF